MRYVKYVRADGVAYHVLHVEWHPADRRIRVILWHNDTDKLPTECIEAP